MPSPDASQTPDLAMGDDLRAFVDASPSPFHAVAELARRLPDVTEQLAREVARATAKLRTLDLLKPPGIAEAMDWATALHTLGASELDPDTAARTLGAVLKYREDTERVALQVRGALFGA